MTKPSKTDLLASIATAYALDLDLSPEDHKIAQNVVVKAENGKTVRTTVKDLTELRHRIEAALAPKAAPAAAPKAVAPKAAPAAAPKAKSKIVPMTLAEIRALADPVAAAKATKEGIAPFGRNQLIAYITLVEGDLSSCTDTVLQGRVLDEKKTDFDDGETFTGRATSATEDKVAAKREATSAASKGSSTKAPKDPNASKAKSKLTITEDVAIFTSYRGEDFQATLHPTGRVTMDGKVFSSPFNAYNKGVGVYRNGWKKWLFVNADGVTGPIDALREGSKGFSTGAVGTSSASKLQSKIDKKVGRIERMEKALTEQRDALAQLKLDLAASEVEGEGETTAASA